MEDHRGEGNDGGIRMISSDELCKHDGVDDEAGEEEEEPKLEHDKHEGHCMAGSAATSNLGKWWMAMNLPATRGDEEMDIDA
uniref:Uncharacterized protein n=1 Tax=Oryza sativa subsp. japonica TaxID=39947 RepID=Q6ERB4_ORYSJ|nr:hypothetical protein [Oryza sativa Japonica Group]